MQHTYAYFVFQGYGQAEIGSFNPQGIGRDSGIPFNFSTFLQDILKSTCLQMSLTSN